MKFLKALTLFIIILKIHAENILNRQILQSLYPGDLFKFTSFDLSLKEFDLIDPNTFSGLINIEELLLQNNNLKTIFPKTFAGLKNLTQLNLGNNQITINDSSIFANL